MRKPILFCVFIVFVCIAFSGCVRLSEYERDVGDLARQLQQERAINASNVKDLELKLKDKSRSVNELAQRYIALEETAGELRAWRAGFAAELSALSADVAELKLIVSKNASTMKGPAPLALFSTIVDIENRLNALIKKREADAVAPAPAVSPAQ